MKKNKIGSSFQISLIRPNLYDWLKVVAVVTMIVDHIGFYLFPGILELRLIGRFAFPIFLFLVGFNGKYQWRWDLLVRGVLVQGAIWLFWYLMIGGKIPWGMNILIVIALVRVILSLLSKRGKSHDQLVCGGVLLMVLGLPFLSGLQSYLQNFLDYGVWGLVFGGLGFLFQKKYLPIGVKALLSLFLLGNFVRYMIGYFGFSQEWMAGVLYGGFTGIGFAFCVLAQELKNQHSFSLKTNTLLDQILLVISRQALVIYGVHIFVLIAISCLIYGVAH